MLKRVKDLTAWLRTTALDPVGGLGIILATIGGILFFVLVLAGFLGFPFNHYAGIFIWICLPAVLLTGLILIPIGRWRVARKYPGGRMPAIDFENPEHLKKLGVFLAITLGNLVLFGFAGYGAYHYSESSEFCGLICHSVMEPEWTAYQLSPHSRVDCVECHIGPGADWFVRSKLSGARQVLAVATGSYTRPIEAPIANLRPARETCEQCHWPEKFHGDKLSRLQRFKSDEANTALQTVLLLKVGGGTQNGKPVGGIHWHTHPSNRVSYVSTDHSRQEIPWVRLERADGTVVDYVSDDYDSDEIDSLLAVRPPRTMDCMDCHNRPTHTFHPPEFALDEAFADGRLDRSVPWLRKHALKALHTDVAPGEDARAAIGAALRTAYADSPAAPDESQLEAATDALHGIWSRNVFPKMGVTWNTYPNFRGHENDSGCFRCHDDSHESATGEVISGDCETCHSLLAWEEETPAILDALYEGTQ